MKPLAAAVHRGGTTQRWSMPSAALPLDESPGSPWLMIPPVVRAVFDALLDAGTPLAASRFGSPLLGVKCGCNDAFIVQPDGDAPSPAVVAVRTRRGAHPARTGLLERALVRPLLRGETLERWRSVAPERIIWPYAPRDASGDHPLAALPAHAAEWLIPWRPRLAARSDMRGSGPWWQLFRTESADATGPRVVWSDIGRTPRAAVLPAGDPTVALNTCYLVRAPSLADARALAALLNGPVAAAWLNVLAEPAHGGYRRYMGWTVSLLPVPAEWARGRELLAPLAERGEAGERVTPSALRAAALAAYGVPREAVEPLLAWAAL
jgi:hypothetical protein